MAVHDSSGNVFEDMGLPDAEGRLAKADVAIRIAQLIKHMGVTQEQAAALMGISQSDVSNITRGSLHGFALERLFRCLNALGQDVRIVITPKQEEHAHTRVAVAAAA